MKCQTCNSEQLVYQDKITTLMCCHPYFDKNGKEHMHDTNIVHASYKCNNGHYSAEQVLNTCWCGWIQNDKPSRIEIETFKPDEPKSLKLGWTIVEHL